MSTPAGWYPDPAGDPTLVRFWDGAAWTAETQPLVQEVAPPPPAAAPPAAPQGSTQPPPPGGVQAEPARFEPAQFEPVEAEPARFEPAQFQPVEAEPVEFDVAQDALVPSADLPPAPAAPAPTPEAPAPAPAAPAPTPAAAPAQGPAAQGPTAQGGAITSIAGITTDLLSDAKYAEIGSGQRVALQNSKLMKVMLGEPVLARQGSMVAFQGVVDFAYEGSGGVGKMLKKVATGEGVPLMRCSGQGEVFLADTAKEIHILYLEQSGLTVNGKNILAFEPSLSWDIEKVKGAGMLAGGLFNTKLQGTGWVAITTDGSPVVLQTDQPTFVDPDAAVAWSSNLTTSLNKTLKGGAMIGRGSGEAFQLSFAGQGIVIVQPSEGGVAPHTHTS